MALRGEMAANSAGAPGLAERVPAKVQRKLVPLLFALYLVAFLDRINIGFAALEMNRDLHLNAGSFGIAAGMFFLGYFFFEVPSNLLMLRTGARKWIARIMVSWGLVAMATVFARGAYSLYLLRFLLGVAEAGFFPGVALYLTYWLPADRIASTVAMILSAASCAGIIGGPLSGALLGLSGCMGLAGWQWLFLLEGLPAVILGFVVLRLWIEDPAHAPWLDAQERDWLRERLRQEHSQKASGPRHMGEAVANPRVWLLSVQYFAIGLGNYGINMWLPQMIKSFGRLSSMQVGLLSAIPFSASALGVITIAWSADRRREYRWHLAGPALVGAGGLLALAQLHTPALALLTLSLAIACAHGAVGPFWSMPSSFMVGSANAGGIALINSMGNLGGFAGPWVVGLLKRHTPSFAPALRALALSLVVAALGALAMPRVPLARPSGSAPES
jgi:ACS family tartrate transporter-like MFS transporter